MSLMQHFMLLFLTNFTCTYNYVSTCMLLSRLIGPVSKRQASNCGAVSVALTPESVGVAN
jgi:hypothetical protein